MRISHEAIYQALYVQGRGALRRELTACLRTGRALRVPRARTRGRGKPFVTPEILISQRPAEATDRAVPGHWEGDLILGLGSSAIGTLVERTTRFTLLLHLPRMAGHGPGARVKNGPALAGHGAEAVRDAIARTITTLPAQLRRSLTWDQGAEMTQHARLRIDTGVAVYFCDPHSPWQRGTNENTNGLLRQYFPKGTDLSVHSADALAAVALTLNTRPRKTLGWRTPAEALDEVLTIGLVGLPKSGKTTLFNLLTGSSVATSRYDAGRAELHTGIARVPDPRVDRLTALFTPKKTTYATFEVVDLAGVEKEDRGGLEAKEVRSADALPTSSGRSPTTPAVRPIPGATCSTSSSRSCWPISRSWRSAWSGWRCRSRSSARRQRCVSTSCSAGSRLPWRRRLPCGR